MVFYCLLEQDNYLPRCTLPELRGPSGQPWKSINFQTSLQGNKSHENWSQGHPKSWKNVPGITRNPISAKVDFCNTFHAKCSFLQTRTPKFRPKNHQKKQPENSYEQISVFGPKKPKKLLKSPPQINKKSIKSKPGPYRVLPYAFQCPGIVQGSSQDPPGRQSRGTKHAKWHPWAP